MAPEWKSNEYGVYLHQPFLNTENDRAIIFIHEHMDDPEIFNEFAEGLNLFHYYSISIPGDEFFETNDIYKNSFAYMCQYVRDLIISLRAKQYFIIAQGTAAPIALFLSNLLPTRIKKISLINPFTSRSTTSTLQWIKTLPRCVEDMEVVMKKMYYPNDNEIFKQGANTKPIVKKMRNVYYYWEDIANYLDDITEIKTLEEIRLFEENVRCPVQLILGEDDEWIPPHEAILAFNNCKKLSIVQIPKAKHYPLHDQKNTTIDAIMKFFIKDLGLNSKDKLPNKYLYKYLDDEWKQYYRTTFAEKLSARDLEKYEKKMKEYEKSQSSIKFKNEEYAEYMKEQLNYQTKALHMAYEQVDQNYKMNKEYEKQIKQQYENTVYIDFSLPANVITTNAQGFQVYHDGKGKGYFQDYDGDWKLIKKQ